MFLVRCLDSVVSVPVFDIALGIKVLLLRRDGKMALKVQATSNRCEALDVFKATASRKEA